MGQAPEINSSSARGIEKCRRAIASRRVVTPGGVRDAVVVMHDGKIEVVVAPADAPKDVAIEDLGELLIMPGVVDSHVHVNEPGRTEWEGFETATKAAAAGGITTIADMPLNSCPVTTTLPAFKEKLAATQGKLFVDCAFLGGVIPGNSRSLESMIDHGISAFKCFLIDSGIDDFPNVTKDDLCQAMPILAKRGVPLMVHAELMTGEPHVSCQTQATQGSHSYDRSHRPHRSYKAFVESRPRSWENEAIKLMIDLCRQFNCPVHIVHLSSSEAVPLIRQAKSDGLPFTTETCPHYLTFALEEIEDGDPRFKCAPPIRERENREKLWQAVADGTIDFVVSDHSPCTPELKFLSEGDLTKAWGGISSLQFGLSVIWTHALERGFDINDVVRWMCQKPAQFLNLSKKKGRLEAGYDADLVVFNPDQSMKIEGSMIQHRHKVTPYDGRQLKGVVKRTYVRGQKIFDQGRLSAEPAGQKLIQIESRI